MKTKKMLKYIKKNSPWKIEKVWVEFGNNLNEKKVRITNKSLKKILKEMIVAIHYV